MEATVYRDTGPEDLALLMTKVDDLAVLPHVVFKVLEISAEAADTAGQEMEKAIIVDPGFSSKVLVRSNSAAYGLPRKVTSIREAINFLGYRAIRNIAMTEGVFDLFVGKNDKESMRRRRWWRQSIDSAVCARWMARELKAGFPEEAYTCGLLHLIGKTLIDKMSDGQYEKVTEIAGDQFTEQEAEQKIFGFDHVQLAIAAATKWGLPPALVAGLDYVSPSLQDDPYRQLRAVCALSSFISIVATDGWTGSESEIQPPAWALETLNAPADRTVQIVDAALVVIAAASRSQ